MAFVYYTSNSNIIVPYEKNCDNKKPTSDDVIHEGKMLELMQYNYSAYHIYDSARYCKNIVE